MSEAFTACVVLCLAACTTPAPPAVEVRTVPADRPVAVSCIKRGEVPARPPTIESERGKGWQTRVDARQAADLLAAKLIEVMGWGGKLHAIAEGCAE